MTDRFRTRCRGGSAPLLLLSALLAGMLCAACRGPAPPSSLAEARELARTADDAGAAAGDAAVARMLLWLTDSSARREIAYDSSSRMPQADAERLRAELVSAGRPTTCTVIERGADAVLAILAGMDSATVAGGRCWLRVALGGGGSVAGMQLFPEDDEYDVRQHLLRAEQLMRDLSGAGTTERAGRDRLRCLPPDDYPDLAALRASLREEFTAGAAEQIIQQRGYFMRDGAVYSPDAPWRHALPWDLTDIAVASRSDRGFTARVSFPMEAEHAEVVVPLVITLDGWRLDQPLGK